MPTKEEIVNAYKGWNIVMSLCLNDDKSFRELMIYMAQFCNSKSKEKGEIHQ